MQREANERLDIEDINIVKRFLYLSIVSGNYIIYCMFEEWDLLAYIILQLLTRLESPNKDSKSPNREFLY